MDEPPPVPTKLPKGTLAYKHTLQIQILFNEHDGLDAQSKFLPTNTLYSC